VLTILLAAVLIIGCSAIVGQGLCAAAGRDEWAWWAPGVGFAAVLTLGGILINAPGHSKTTALGIAAATLGALAVPRVRSALATALPDGLPVAAITLLASLLPFLVSGRAGIIGASINNDTGAHLATAWWLEHHQGPVPVGALGGPLALVGYPVGPHGLADALSQNVVSLVRTFDAVIIAVGPLTALVALGAVQRAPRFARWAAATLVGLCYMAASFTIQASFKETMEALFVLATVLATRDLVATVGPGTRWRAGVPLGITIGGTIWVYSYGGLLWTVGAAVATALVSAPWRRIWYALPGVVLGAAVVIAPGLDDIERFRSSPFNHEVGDGNLLHALNPVEGLGVWFNYDFRWTPQPLWPTAIFAGIAGIAAIVAVYRLIRAHKLALPAALIPILGAYAYAADKRSIYLAAKALTVASPLIALTIAVGLLMPLAPRRRGAALALSLLAIGVAAPAAVSSFMALREGRVGPEAHSDELSRLKPYMRNGAVLFMPKDDMVQWELVGIPLYQGRHFYAPLTAPLSGPKPTLRAGFFDFDNFSSATLDKFRYAITTNTPYQSTPPRNWHRYKRTRSFILWKRRGTTPMRYPTDFGSTPGRILDCNSDVGRRRLAQAGSGFALVWPKPVIGRSVLWSNQTFLADSSANMTLNVPRGRWDVSLAYAATTGLDVRAGSIRRSMPATTDRVGPFYLVGTVTQQRSGPLAIHVRAKPLGTIGRLLGGHGRTRGLDSPSNQPLGSVALTRHGVRPRRVQPRQACGRYTDYVQPPQTAGR
jgi:hypothetical protein